MTKSLSKIKNKIIPILKQNDIAKASIFGSYARGQANSKSDVDMMIEYKKKKSLLDLIGLEQELEEKIGIKFDITTYKAINYLIRDQVYKDQVVILNKNE